jgi:hypothetical protein
MMWKTSRALTIASTVLIASGVSAGQQVKYAIDQNVQPVFEGWERNSDGTFTLDFGYLNRNYEEEVDVQIGTENHFEPGDPDRGQPTHFDARRHRFVFKVPLPKGWDPKARLTWAVTSHGRTDKALGWLQPEWEVDAGVEQMNIGPGGAPDEDNKPPEVKGQSTYSASLDAPLTLSVIATDDGIPKPRKPRNEAQAKMMRPQGVRLFWTEYRGPGRVDFEPREHPAVYGTPLTATTKVKFAAPGDYVLRAIVGDGTLETNFDIKVTVAKSGSAER